MVCKHRRPFHASRIAVRHITGTNMFLHAGPLRIRLPPTMSVGRVHPNTIAERVVFGNTVRTNPTVRQWTLHHGGIDGIATRINKHTTVFVRLLREISGGSPQHGAVHAIISMIRIIIVENRAGPVHDERSATTLVTFRIIIGNPQAFAGPRHTQLKMRTVRLA